MSVPKHWLLVLRYFQHTFFYFSSFYRFPNVSPNINRMWTLAGHMMAGCFYAFVGIWWMICIIKQWFNCQNNNSIFISTASYTIVEKRFPIEPMFKTLFLIVGFTIETINSDNFQHSRMYLFFGLAWIIDFLIFFHVKLPKDLDYVCLCLTVAMEGLLFKCHLYGLHTLEVILHMF
jgi:hypothetical protein